MYLPTSALANETDDDNKSYDNSTHDAILIYAAAGAVTVAAVLGLSTVFKRASFKQLMDKYKKTYAGVVEHDGDSLLSFASDRREVRSLVKEGYDVNAQNNYGLSPIFSVQETGAVKELIRNGADVNMRSNDGSTPLFYAYNKDKAKELIEAGADIHARNNDGDDAISFLQETHRDLVEKANDPLRSDMMYTAVVQGQVKETIDYLSSLSR